jgi:hypothetical protein
LVELGVKQARKTSKSPTGERKSVKAAAREVARTRLLASEFAKVAPDEDQALIAGAIAIFAAEIIKRSSSNLLQARGYLYDLRDSIEGLLKNAFRDSQRPQKEQEAGAS